MMNDEYSEARRIAEKIAASFDLPRFYREKIAECTLSRERFEQDRTVQACLAILKGRAASYGHGLSHARKVALDAGAIILVEESLARTTLNFPRLVFLAHVAGVLHDIERSKPNHAHLGAVEAGKILQQFDLSVTEINAVTDAIRNHEAFQPCEALEDDSTQLLSDALYDADKFRWGPDNFTEMILDILKTRHVPIAKLLDRFLPGLTGIEKISTTFRSQTGKEYGPDFIDRGIRIGKLLYEELSQKTTTTSEGYSR